MNSAVREVRGTFARIFEWLLNGGSRAQNADGYDVKQAAPTDASPRATRAQGALAENAAVRKLLAQLRESKINATAGMIQMVQLGDVRLAFGDKWAGMADTAMSIAQKVLEHRLGPSDLFTRVSDLGFVVVFTQLNPEDARRRAEAISREICLLLQKIPDLSRAIAVQQVTARISQLAPDDVDEILEAITIGLQALCQKSTKSDGSTLNHLGPEGVRQASHSATPDIAPVASNQIQSQVHSSPNRHSNVSSAHAEPTLATLPSVNPQEQNSPPAGLSLAALPNANEQTQELETAVSYVPTLDVPSQIVAINTAVLRRRAEDGSWLTGQFAYLDNPNDDYTLDLLLCHRAVTDLRNLANERRAVPIVASAHIESLSHSRAFQDLLSQLTVTEQKHLILEIVKLDSATPVSKIVDAVCRYRVYLNTILLRVPITDAQVNSYATSGIHSIGCHIDIAELASLSETRRLELMRSFASKARLSGLSCHFYGVHDSTLAAMAVACKPKYITGRFVGPMSETPVQPYKM